MTFSEPLHVLLVEDSEDDLFFFRRLWTKAGAGSPLAVAMDGQQAINHLARAVNPAIADRPPLPAVVFLDLKLPLKSGFEVLEWIRAQPALANVVVVVLSSSGEARDIAQAIKLGAHGYLVKYPEPAVLRNVVEQVTDARATGDLAKLALPGIPRPQ